MAEVTPSVSVIIPAYNCDRFISQALESVFSQTFKNYEIIVVDDGSTDTTPQVLKRFEPRIQIIRQENGGVAAARNSGILVAKGELIAFLDADDIFFPEKLEKQVSLFAQQASLEVVISGWQIMDQSGEPIAQVTPWETKPELDLACIVLYKPARPSATMIRRQVFDRLGSFDTTLTSGEDLDWLLRVMAAECKASWLPEVQVGYRQHSESLMTKGQQLLVDTDRIMQRFFSRSDLPPEILQLQQQERYQSLAWLAARMYYDGHLSEAGDCLARTLFYAKSKDFRLVSDWFQIFRGYAAEYGHRFNAYELTNAVFWKLLSVHAIAPWRDKHNQRSAALQANCSDEISLALAPHKSHRQDGLSNLPSRNTVLLYSDDPGAGGVLHCNHAIVCHLQKHGYEVSHACFQQNTPLSEKEEALGVEAINLGYHSGQNPEKSRMDIQGAQRLFQKHRPSLIVFSDGWPFSNLAAKQAAIGLGIPFIIVLGFIESSCVDFDRQDGVNYRKLAALQYRHAQEVIAVSDNNLQLLRQLFELPQSLGRVIYNGRPSEYFEPAKQAGSDRLRQAFNIPPNDIICFTSGRLEPVKGYQYQLEAMGQLKHLDVWKRLWFAWAGVGATELSSSNESELKETAKALGVQDRVIFLGQRWDIPDWLDASDIFVLTSEAEGMPLSVMEAMAKGLPVVATAVSGVPEELGDTGQLLSDPTENAEATVNELVETLEAWASSQTERERVGQEGKARASKLFQQENMLKRYEKIVAHIFSQQSATESEKNSSLEPSSQTPSLSTDPTLTPRSIWQVESSFHYASLIWTAWSRYMAADFAGMDRALEQALRSPCAPQGWPILEWGSWFTHFCKERGVAFNSTNLVNSEVWMRLTKSFR